MSKLFKNYAKMMLKMMLKNLVIIIIIWETTEKINFQSININKQVKID